MRFRKAESKTVAMSIVASLIIATIVPYVVLNIQPQGSADTNLATQLEDEENVEAIATALEDYYTKLEEEANKPKKVEGVSADDDAFLGSEDAPVTIVEFTEYECPYCQRHSHEVLSKIEENYINNGKVKYVVRDFIVHGATALNRSMAAECVRDQGGDSAYYAYHDLLFGDAFGAQYDDMPQALAELAGEIEGIDTTRVQECIESEVHKTEVMADTSDAQELGVRGTPNFFINGWHIKGAFPYETFEQYIEQELAAQ